MADIPWEMALDDLFTAPLTPPQVEQRGIYWKDDDEGINHSDQNMALRLRSYDSDGHNARQEATFVAGTAGILLQGNDSAHQQSAVVTFADIILQSATAMNLNVPSNGLYWNDSPFNPGLNPNFTAPGPILVAEDAFNFAIAATPGLDNLQAAQQAIQNIQDTVGSLGATDQADGAVNFSDPYQIYCTLTAQKIPMMNFAAIMFLQMLMDGTPGLLTAGPVPVSLDVVGLALQPLEQMSFQTAYNASVQGSLIGQTFKSLLLSAIPGANLVLS